MKTEVKKRLIYQMFFILIDSLIKPSMGILKIVRKKCEKKVNKMLEIFKKKSIIIACKRK